MTETSLTEPSAEFLETRAQIGLEREAFVSPEIFADELERFFRPQWMFVGHASQVAEPGQFLRYDLVGDSVVIVRGKDGELRAMHNVCVHRGARLIHETAGQCKHSMICPYHGWAYGFDGKLRAAPRMNPTVEPGSMRLKPAHVEVWNGLVFASIAEQAPVPITEQLADADFDAYTLAQTKIADKRTYTLKANWKVAWENGLECYHCALNHPELRHVAQLVRAGAQAGHVGPLGYDYRPHYPLLPTAKTLTSTGEYGSKRLLGPADRPAEKVAFLQWHRSAFEILAAPDHVQIMSYRPLSPRETEVTWMALVHEDATPGEDFDFDELFGLHWVTRGQDDALCEQIQLGVESSAFVPGPYNLDYEFANQAFLRSYRTVMA